jgi:hypothetical protein
MRSEVMSIIAQGALRIVLWTQLVNDPILVPSPDFRGRMPANEERQAERGFPLVE